MSEVKIIGVVGGGQMGSGIAQVAAMHGVDVVLHDLDHRALSKASSSISSSIDRFVSKGTLSQVTPKSNPLLTSIAYTSVLYNRMLCLIVVSLRN